MGKKRIVTKSSGAVDTELKKRALSRLTKKKLTEGIIYVQSTYNNTKLLLTDKKGNSLAWATSGSLGFKGARKGTPFAASKVAELLVEKAGIIGIKSVDVVIRGVGAGRESSIRTIASKGIDITSIKDRTPIPFNGPRPKKPRRV